MQGFEIRVDIAEAALAEAHRKLDEATELLRDAVPHPHARRYEWNRRVETFFLASSRPAAPVADDKTAGEVAMNVNDSSGEPVGVRVHSCVKADEPATCVHGETRWHEVIVSDTEAVGCPGPVSSTAAGETT